MDNQRRKGIHPAWYILLLIPFIGTLIPSFYASVKPELWGFPYFYWYQILWIFISAILTFIVYSIDKKKSR